MVLGILINYFLVRSRFGIIMASVKDDEAAAMASGVDVPRYKFYILLISIFLAGLAGGLYAFLNGVISPPPTSLRRRASRFSSPCWAVELR
jgi:branched-chain amino acid transport system permease protein